MRAEKNPGTIGFGAYALVSTKIAHTSNSAGIKQSLSLPIYPDMCPKRIVPRELIAELCIVFWGRPDKMVLQGSLQDRTVIVPCGSVLGGAAQNGGMEQCARNENRAVR